MLGIARASLDKNSFYGLRFIIEKCNDLDASRLREVGPDRACAEWLLRCRGTVRFDDDSPEFAEYYHFAQAMEARKGDDAARKAFLTHVRANDACITARGCKHFEGVSKLHDVNFSGCKNLDDEAIDMFVNNVGESLHSFELSNCRLVTPDGLRLLGKCSKLTQLALWDLSHFSPQDWEKLTIELKQKLPRDCKIASDASRG